MLSRLFLGLPAVTTWLLVGGLTPFLHAQEIKPITSDKLKQLVSGRDKSKQPVLLLIHSGYAVKQTEANLTKMANRLKGAVPFSLITLWTDAKALKASRPELATVFSKFSAAAVPAEHFELVVPDSIAVPSSMATQEDSPEFLAFVKRAVSNAIGFDVPEEELARSPVCYRVSGAGGTVSGAAPAPCDGRSR